MAGDGGGRAGFSSKVSNCLPASRSRPRRKPWNLSGESAKALRTRPTRTAHLAHPRSRRCSVVLPPVIFAGLRSSTRHG
ncbi:hypothetical protein GGTG_13576 [Gaeumannomyces tritici R3-111a-1]|uniref:Uncharacterized protein n=1 Tax=Gaeumannomyces tritici (strain R3-111a-1) TaxID=644352 RepID=J3PJ95_GAET3|nr:hypothetical protein GGTG_13576 [Gaeumannomyces tritici R3-111a-1]EJT68867.1 hypothetical protein GGTG_13576 [Gaeumannomyces tritici R3-111a-1]